MAEMKNNDAASDPEYEDFSVWAVPFGYARKKRRKEHLKERLLRWLGVS
jgi:hypothetical protein